MRPLGFSILSITSSQASMHAVQFTHSSWSTVPDVYARWAGIYAHFTIDTISFIILTLALFSIGRGAPPQPVVHYGNAVISQKYALQPAVRTHSDAYLFS
jgi:hypothetical protein